MSDPFREKPIPRAILWAAAGLCSFSILLAGGARLSGYRAIEPPQAEIVKTRNLIFEDGSDGAILVRNQADGTLVSTLPADGRGFVRSVMRSLALQRADKAEYSPTDMNAPFTVTYWSDGRVTLSDGETEEHLELSAFGIDNVNAFADFLIDEEQRS